MYNADRELPVPIDIIIESRLKIDIVPMANLKESLDNDAFIARDFSTIYLDQDVYLTFPTRYRFSLAHEIGHFWLHKKVYESLEFGSVDEWLEAYLSIDDEDYGWLEYQANMFAGFVLIPDYALQPRFEDALRRTHKEIDLAKKSNLVRDQYIDFVVSSIARTLAPSFNVSAVCMETRIARDNRYASLIP
jgi:Zn-dependent peptidase ImmA (M78 family)